MSWKEHVSDGAMDGYRYLREGAAVDRKSARNSDLVTAGLGATGVGIPVLVGLGGTKRRLATAGAFGGALVNHVAGKKGRDYKRARADRWDEKADRIKAKGEERKAELSKSMKSLVLRPGGSRGADVPKKAGKGGGRRKAPPHLHKVKKGLNSKLKAAAKQKMGWEADQAGKRQPSPMGSGKWKRGLNPQEQRIVERHVHGRNAARNIAQGKKWRKVAADGEAAGKKLYHNPPRNNPYTQTMRADQAAKDEIKAGKRLKTVERERNHIYQAVNNVKKNVAVRMKPLAHQKLSVPSGPRPQPQVRDSPAPPRKPSGPFDGYDKSRNVAPKRKPNKTLKKRP